MKDGKALDDGSGRAWNTIVDTKSEVNDVAGTGLVWGREGIMTMLTSFDPRRSNEPLSAHCHLFPYRNVRVAVWRARLGWGTTAVNQAFGGGWDSGGKTGVLSMFFMRDSSNMKFFINRITVRTRKNVPMSMCSRHSSDHQRCQGVSVPERTGEVPCLSHRQNKMQP